MIDPDIPWLPGAGLDLRPGLLAVGHVASTQSFTGCVWALGFQPEMGDESPFCLWHGVVGSRQVMYVSSV